MTQPLTRPMTVRRWAFFAGCLVMLLSVGTIAVFLLIWALVWVFERGPVWLAVPAIMFLIALLVTVVAMEDASE